MSCSAFEEKNLILSLFKNVLIPAALLMLLAVAAEMCVPYLFQRVIDEGLLKVPEQFDWFVVFTILVTVCVYGGWLLQKTLLNSGASKSEKMILDQLLQRWLHLPESFYRGRSFSELRLRLESAFEVKKFLVGVSGKGLFALLELLAVFALLEYYEKALLFSLLFLPAIGMTIFAYYLTRHYTGIFELAREGFLQKADDITRGVFSIRAAGTEAYFSQSQRDLQEKMLSQTAVARRNLAWCEKLASFFALLAGLCLFYDETVIYRRK